MALFTRMAGVPASVMFALMGAALVAGAKSFLEKTGNHAETSWRSRSARRDWEQRATHGQSPMLEAHHQE
jgi:hypothetical protein